MAHAAAWLLNRACMSREAAYKGSTAGHVVLVLLLPGAESSVQRPPAVPAAAVLNANETAEAAAQVEDNAVGADEQGVDQAPIEGAGSMLPALRRLQAAMGRGLKAELLTGSGAMPDPLAPLGIAGPAAVLDPEAFLAPGVLCCPLGQSPARAPELQPARLAMWAGHAACAAAAIILLPFPAKLRAHPRGCCRPVRLAPRFPHAHHTGRQRASQGGGGRWCGAAVLCCAGSLQHHHRALRSALKPQPVPLA